MIHRTLVGLAAVVTLGCVSAATNALAADHQSGNHGNGGRAAAVHASGAHLMASYSGGGHVARYGGGYRAGPIYDGPVYDRPIYNRCAGYDPVYGGCAGYGVPLVGGVIDSLLCGSVPIEGDRRVLKSQRPPSRLEVRPQMAFVITRASRNLPVSAVVR